MPLDRAKRKKADQKKKKKKKIQRIDLWLMVPLFSSSFPPEPDSVTLLLVPPIIDLTLSYHPLQIPRYLYTLFVRVLSLCIHISTFGGTSFL